MTGQTQNLLYARRVTGSECKDLGNAPTVKGKEPFRNSKRRQRSDKGQRREVKPTAEQQALAKASLAAARDSLNAARREGSTEEFAVRLLTYAGRLGEWERVSR